jgi:ABC-type sugar transport system ATPase subunit
MGRESDPITSLSGGNQQKVVIARWLARDPRVLLLNDPTRGVDIGAKRDIYALLDDLTGRGVAVVMLSTEVDEHIELMDRVLVFREGALSATLTRPELTRQSLVAAFFGRTVGADDTAGAPDTVSADDTGDPAPEPAPATAPATAPASAAPDGAS